MKCDICKTSGTLITATDKAKDRADYPGVDFYDVICWKCWEIEKARR